MLADGNEPARSLGLSTPGKSDAQMLNSPQKRGTGNILHPDLLVVTWVYIQIEIYHQYILRMYDVAQFLKNLKKKAFSLKVKYFLLRNLISHKLVYNKQMNHKFSSLLLKQLIIHCFRGHSGCLGGAHLPLDSPGETAEDGTRGRAEAAQDASPGAKKAPQWGSPRLTPHQRPGFHPQLFWDLLCDLARGFLLVMHGCWLPNVGLRALRSRYLTSVHSPHSPAGLLPS